MTVAEVIKALKEHDKDKKVWVDSDPEQNTTRALWRVEHDDNGVYMRPSDEMLDE